MHKSIIQTLLLSVLLFIGFPTVASAQRVALVIGNSNYVHARTLRNPVNDAKAVAEALKRLNFSTVEVALDLGVDEMRRAIRKFGDLSASADVAFVYYAGHGMELGGTNYLVPTDAKLKKDRDLHFEAITLDLLLSVIEPARQMRIVVLDACRDNPLAARMEITGQLTRSVSRGFGRVEPDGATLVAYAAKAGKVADDGDADHSPYTQALLEHLETPGLEIRLLFGKVRDSVLAATRKQQRPAIYGDIGGQQFFFKAPQGGALQNTAGRLQAPLSADETLWMTIKDSNKVSEFEFYLNNFPTGRYSAVAELKIRQLKEPKVAVGIDQEGSKPPQWDAEKSTAVAKLPPEETMQTPNIPDRNKSDHPFDGIWRVSVDKRGCQNNNPARYFIHVKKGRIDEPNYKFSKKGSISNSGAFKIQNFYKNGRFAGVLTGNVTATSGKGRLLGINKSCQGSVAMVRVLEETQRPRNIPEPNKSDHPFDGLWKFAQVCFGEKKTYHFDIRNGRFRTSNGPGTVSRSGKIEFKGRRNYFNGTLKDDSGSGAFGPQCTAEITRIDN